MNNLGAALLQKQRQSSNNSTIDLAAIQHKFNVEIQQLIATINALKGENDALKSEIDGLKAENDALKNNNNKINEKPQVKFLFL
jgi:FtsZ-binding cell division protein ZapB